MRIFPFAESVVNSQRTVGWGRRCARIDGTGVGKEESVGVAEMHIISFIGKEDKKHLSIHGAAPCCM